MRHPFCLSLLLLTVGAGSPAPAWASPITITFTGVVDEILDPHQVLAHVGVQPGDGATATYVLRTDEDAERVVQFGDGVQGRRPPSGSSASVGAYRVGGGSAGSTAPDAHVDLFDDCLRVVSVFDLQCTGESDGYALRISSPLDAFVLLLASDGRGSVVDRSLAPVPAPLEDWAQAVFALRVRGTEGQEAIVTGRITAVESVPAPPTALLLLAGLAALGARRALHASIARARCLIARPSRPW
jgi:hypothetical protein